LFWSVFLSVSSCFNSSKTSNTLGSIFLVASDHSCDIIGAYTVDSMSKNSRWTYFTLLQLIIPGLIYVASQITVPIIWI
jgi:hypothetical protein